MKRIITLLLTVMLIASSSVSVFAITLDVAKIGETPFASLEEAIGAVQDGETITLLKDAAYETNGTGLLNITKSITLNGNGHTLSGYGDRSGNKTTLAINNNGTNNVDVTIKNLTINNDGDNGRAIETRGNINSLTLYNVILDTTGSGNNQVLTIGGSQSGLANINIIDSKFNAGDGGYGIVNFNPTNITINRSEFNGYSSILFREESSSYGSAGTIVNAKDSTFNNPNNSAYGSNDFGAFVLYADNIDLTFDSCKINVQRLNTANQAVIQENYGRQIVKNGMYNVEFKGDCEVNGILLDIRWGSGDPYKHYAGNIVINSGKYTLDNTFGKNAVDSENDGFSFSSESVDISDVLKIKGGVFNIQIPEEYIWDDTVTPIDYTSVVNNDSSTCVKYPWTIGKRTIELPEQEKVDSKQVSNKTPSYNEQPTKNEVINKIRFSSVDLAPEAATLAASKNVISQSLITKAKTKTGFTGAENEELNIEVRTFLDIEVTNVNKQEGQDNIQNFKADITSKYIVTAYKSVSGQEKETYEIVSERIVNVDRSILVRVYLPDNFKSSNPGNDRVWVRHYLKDGSAKVYGGDNGFEIKTDSTGRYVEFENPDGFSEFEFFLEKVNPIEVTNTSRHRYNIVKTSVK